MLSLDGDEIPKDRPLSHLMREQDFIRKRQERYGVKHAVQWPWNERKVAAAPAPAPRGRVAEASQNKKQQQPMTSTRQASNKPRTVAVSSSTTRPTMRAAPTPMKRKPSSPTFEGGGAKKLEDERSKTKKSSVKKPSSTR